MTGPAAWFIRFTGAHGIICPLGFGGFTIPSIVAVAQGRTIIDVRGNYPPYAAPLERTDVPVTVLLLLAALLAACLVQLAGGILLICLQPSGFVVMPAGMLLSAIFWWGFDLPLAWINAAITLPLLGTELICRDRAGCDADGGARGAPDAVQVADRPPTLPCSGRRSAPADTRAAAGRSAATSRVSAETRPSPLPPRPRRRSGP